ncbi:hypothetical protein L6J37_19910, partial [Photobacterium sp. WH77]|uniref:hypothetical protein n=1 Tax=unclassified Photobacterium TaxID=2628852 RepID=UPI001EDA0548
RPLKLIHQKRDYKLKQQKHCEQYFVFLIRVNILWLSIETAQPNVIDNFITLLSMLLNQYKVMRRFNKKVKLKSLLSITACR